MPLFAEAREKVACKVGKIWDKDKACDVEASFSREDSVSRVAEKGQQRLDEDEEEVEMERKTAKGDRAGIPG